MINQSNKYSVCHPLITPEFFIPEYSGSHKIKALALYPDTTLSPDILYDLPSSSIQYVFGSYSSFSSVAIHPNYHMYVKDYPNLDTDKCNVYATKLYRSSTLYSYGIDSHRSIFGSVIIFGSVSAQTKLNDGRDYSVPYELIEQVVRIYNHYVNH